MIIATVPIHGHVTPHLAIARHLVERGDRVRFLTGSRFADVVRATGAEHLPLQGAADFDDRIDFDQAFPGRSEQRGAKAVAFDVLNLFIEPVREQYRGLVAALEAEPAEVVIADPAFGGAAGLLQQPRDARPAVIVGGVLPLALTSRDTAPNGFGLPPMPGPLGRARNAVLNRIVRGVFADVNARAEQIAVELTGRPFGYSVLDWTGRADALAQFTVPEFEYPRSDAPAGLRFLGPISASGSQAPLPAWWGELEAARAVVHVTQGTIGNKDWSQLVAPALEALADEDVLVVVATGGRPLDTLPPLPANARAAEYLPYDELLPRTDVVVTNGGYGGVQYALRYGVPLVAAGRGEDKPEVVARVAWSGVGIGIQSSAPSPARLRRAVRRVLAQPRYRAASRAMAARMAASPGLDGFSELVDELRGRGRQLDRV